MRSGCGGFESRSGHLIFSSICSVYIDRHIRVDLSDDEQAFLGIAVLLDRVCYYISLYIVHDKGFSPYNINIAMEL